MKFRSIFLTTLIMTSIGLANARAQSDRPVVSIEGDRFLIDGELTYKGRYWNGNKIEGLLLNARLVQGVFDDENPNTRELFRYPDTGKWDPDRNTNEFVAAMPEWYSYGLNSFTINFQGGSPTGYGNKDWINTAYTETGELKPAYMDRMSRILDKAEELKMVPIVSYFYFGQDHNLADEAAVINATKNVTNWILDKGYRNVLIEVNNECSVQKWDHEILRPERVHELIELVKSINTNGRRLLVSTSYKGGDTPGNNVAKVSDFILLHGNGVRNPARIKEMVAITRSLDGYKGQPIVFNEDDHYGYEKEVNNFKYAIESYASWGYFDFRRKNETDIRIGYQSVPVDWGVNHQRKQAFFDYCKEISGK